MTVLPAVGAIASACGIHGDLVTALDKAGTDSTGVGFNPSALEQVFD